MLGKFRIVPFVASVGLLLVMPTWCAAQWTTSGSNIYYNSGNVGIGTTTPGPYKLDVEGGSVKIGTNMSEAAYEALLAYGSDGHSIRSFPSLGAGNYNNIIQSGDSAIIYSNGGWGTDAFAIAPWSNPTSGLRMDANGSVGIGTTSPVAPLSVYTASNNSTSSASSASALSIVNATPNGGFITSMGYTNIGVSSVLSASATSAKAAYYSYISNSTANEAGLYIDGVASSNNYGIYSPVAGLQSYFNGNVGIGTTAPGVKLEVNGNVKLTSGSGASVTFADGTAQNTAWTGVLCGGDYAESVGVSGERASYETGDVLAIDDGIAGNFVKVSEPYSTGVAGIYSTKPGVLGRRQATEKSPSEVPMAMIGIVPVKVSAENGPIKPKDLLVSSSTPGYAMKGTDRSLLTGAMIGKAMGSLNSGTGVIEVLVTLQ